MQATTRPLFTIVTGTVPNSPRADEIHDRVPVEPHEAVQLGFDDALLIAVRPEAFRAVLARARWEQGHWCLASDDARRLGLDVRTDRGARLRAAPLALGPERDNSTATEPLSHGERA